MAKIDDTELMRICKAPLDLTAGFSVFSLFAQAAYNDCINGVPIKCDSYPAVMLPYVDRIYGMAT